MKLKKDFVLRQIAGTWAVLPLGLATLDFNGMLTLNESGVLLWKALEQGGDRNALVDVLTGNYNISQTIAQADVDEFLDKLAKAGCVEE